jgi:DnaJ-domain-containing protein 1
MNPIEYYSTTIIAAFKTVAPFLVFLVGGYLLFIKGPFLLLRKSMREQKEKLRQEEDQGKKEVKYSVDDYLAFQQKLKLMNRDAPSKPSQKKPEGEKNQNQKSRQEEFKHNGRQERAQKEKKSEPKTSTSTNPEDIFQLKPGERLSREELKKRYFQLLKENHPDRVASLGPDFKELAEKNTKEINKAYEVLKKKAS